MRPVIHAILEWNPTRIFNPLAPEGIKLWTDVLKRFEPKTPESYTYWGKISKSGALGMQPFTVWAKIINDQTESQPNATKETHLYIYCADFPDRPPSLHVGRILDVIPDQNSVPLGDEHVPSDFYLSVKNQNDKYRRKFEEGRLIPIWFKLADIRQIPTRLLYNLQVCSADAEPIEDFDAVSRIPYPCAVIEKDPQVFFDDTELEREGRNAWWEECQDNVIVPSLELSDRTAVIDQSQTIVLRTADAMARCVAPVLRRATKIKFVDPYFDPLLSRFRNPLTAFLEWAQRRMGEPLSSIEYHLKERGRPGQIKQDCKNGLPIAIPEGISLKLFFWAQKKGGERLHDRFILTGGSVGIRFPGGLDEDDAANTRQTTEVSVLSQQNCNVFWDRFDRYSRVYWLKDTLGVRGTRKSGRSGLFNIPIS